MVHNPAMLAPEQRQVLQVALKCNQLGVFYINDSIPEALLAAATGGGGGGAQQQAMAFF